MESPITQFEQASRQHMDAIYTSAYRLTKSATKAEELVQLTYLRAFAAFEKTNSRIDFKSWILSLLEDIHQELTSDVLQSKQRIVPAY